MAKRLTAREKECRKIARDKAAKLRRQTIKRRFILSTTLVGMMGAAALGWWGWATNAPSRAEQYAEDQVFGWTKHAGFEVRDMYLLGRRITPMQDIQTALGIKPGDPILASSVSTLKERLEQLPYIREAEVERELPHTLHIQITEREPVAVWQSEGRYDLVDMDGKVIPMNKVKPLGKLPIVVGSDAPAHVPELLRFLVKEPELFAQVASAVRIGERRWDIHLKKGVIVKLPEEKPEAAWHQLAQMQQEQKLLERAITAVDLRMENRVYIKLLPSALPEKAANARET